MAIKLGKYYLTRNDPRYLLRKIAKLENQQTEFIKCLEKEIIDSSTCSGQQYYARQHLKLYKEIIGDKDEEDL